MIINNSAGKANWSQLKNKVEPLSTCNVTACINAAQSAGYDVESRKRGFADRPSDDLLLFIRSNKQCNDLWLQLDADKYIPINQWMAVLALGLGLWLGDSKLATFRMTSWEPMRDCIIAGGACVISGRYKTMANPIDHISAVVGIEHDGENVLNWIVDDSYGDYRTKYVSKMGDNIIMPHADFMEYTKEQRKNSKRCIFVPKKGD